MQKSLRTKEHKTLIGLLIKMRNDAGISQVDLAKKLKKPQSFVNKYEIGERRLDFVEVYQICKALKTDFNEFVNRFEKV